MYSDILLICNTVPYVLGKKAYSDAASVFMTEPLYYSLNQLG